MTVAALDVWLNVILENWLAIIPDVGHLKFSKQSFLAFSLCVLNHKNSSVVQGLRRSTEYTRLFFKQQCIYLLAMEALHHSIKDSTKH